MVGAVVLSPTNAASQEAVVGSAQRVVVAHARAPRDSVVQHCLEYLGSSILILSSRGVFGRSYSSRVYIRKLHHTLRMRRLASMDKSAILLTFHPRYINSFGCTSGHLSLR